MTAKEICIGKKGVCAHRGFSAKNPENSIQAFDAALSLGADEIELDVRMTSDGKMIISHDNRLDRISDGKPDELVSTSTFDYLKTLNIGINAGTEAHFTTPEEDFEKYGGKIILNIHLKEAGEDGIIVKNLSAMAKAGGFADMIYFAGSPNELAAMEKYAPEIERCAIQLPKDTVGIYEMATTYHCSRVQLWSGMYDKKLIEQIHEAGIRINLYHAEKREEIASAWNMGVDTVLANNTDVAVLARTERRRMAQPGEISIRYMQNYIRAKKGQRDTYEPDMAFVKLTEEVGELARAHIRGKKHATEENLKDTLEEELCDVIYYTLKYANAVGVDLEHWIPKKEEYNSSRYPCGIDFDPKDDGVNKE